MKSIVLTVLIVFLCVNVGLLYYMVLFGDIPQFQRRVAVLEKRMDSLVKRDAGVDETVGADVQVGGLVVLSEQQKEEMIEAFDLSQKDLIKSLVAAEVKTVVGGGFDNVAKEGVKEYFVPLGSASVKTSDFNWKDTAVQTEFDLGNYGKVVSVSFEAVLWVPTGNGEVQVRLIDSQLGVVGGERVGGEFFGRCVCKEWRFGDWTRQKEFKSTNENEFGL